MTFPIRDVSSWQEDVYEYGQGEREKKWLIEPNTNRLAMLKFPRENRGEHWAEKLSSEFAKIIEFPCADVDLAVYEGRQACLSYFFVDSENGYSHFDGRQYFPNDYDEVRNIGYNFQLIESILQKHGLVEEFLYIVVFDALIGEGDRHQNNWGVMRHEKSGELSISPLYDNSACLCRDKLPVDAKALVESRAELLKYIHRSKAKMGWNAKRQEKHFVLIRSIYSMYPEKVGPLLNKLNLLTDDKIHEVVYRLPDEVIALEQRELVIQYVSSRRDILVRIGEAMKHIPSELLMVWKDPDTRQRFVVGELIEMDGSFSFRYVNPALEEAQKHGFQNYPAFPDLDAVYEQPTLFQPIVNRLPRPKRPDYALILERYGVDPSSSLMEILEATRGRIPTDTFEFVRKIRYVANAPLLVDFEIAAARHYDLLTVADQLQIGTELIMEREPNNEHDPYAVVVKTVSLAKLGYVPMSHSSAISEMLDHVGRGYHAVINRIDLANQSSDEWITMQVEVRG